MEKHKSAMYQRDIMYQFKNLCDVIFYGPGFDGFNSKENIKDVIYKLGGADFLIFGHSWLNDYPGIDADPHPLLNLEDCPIPKVAIINKEYRNLESKLKWIKEKNFTCAFSHYQDVVSFEKKTKVPFKFIPFGFNEKLFSNTHNSQKIYDFAFSGIMQNIIGTVNQSDTRIRVMKRLFYCLGDVALKKKSIYEKYNIFWNGLPRKKFEQKVAIWLKKYCYLNDAEYAKLHLKTKTFLNTISPYGLVSPRFYESMASSSLVFCEDSKIIDNVIPSECFIKFKKDFSDFDEKFELALSDGKERERIISNAKDFVFTNNTWKVLVDDMLEFIKKKIY